MKKQICAPRIYSIAFFLAVLLLFSVTHGLAQTIPPTSPTGLAASAATCGEVDLSWSPAIDNSGTGLYSYTIQRSDGVNAAIGAIRTWYDDTNFVKSSTTTTYYVVAKDNAGNTSLPSNSVTVTTPACPTLSGEQVISGASVGTLDAKEPLGKAIATWGTQTTYLYTKRNSSLALDVWAYINDSGTGQTSTFLLHTYPGYPELETDYVFTSATTLWTIARDQSVTQQ